MPTLTASTAASSARKRSGPPSSAYRRPMAYHSQPSPPRVAATIQRRIQRGGVQRFTRRIRRWSRAESQCKTEAAMLSF